MAYPNAAGRPSMSGNYIPEIWSGKTLVKFYRTSVFGDISNTDYEGEIKDKGDSVKIRTIPDITINDYELGTDLIIESPAGGVVELLIDQGFYYNIGVEDLEKLESDIPYIEKWATDAGEQLANKQDKKIFSTWLR